MTHRLANAGLFVLTAGLAAIALAMVAVPAITGLQAFTVDRNSMQREVAYGSLEYAQAQPDYKVGDIVVFTHNGNVITHRLVAELPDPATGAPAGTWFRSQGSENLYPDDWELSKANIIGKVVWHAPYLGLATKVLATWPIRLFLILTAVGLIALSGAAPTRPRPAPVTERGGGGLELNG